MSIKINTNHVKSLQANIRRLFRAASYSVGEIIENPLYGEHVYQGVYVMTDPNDDAIVYIGKTNDGTKENGLADRIWAHAQKKSEIQSALSVDPDTFRKYRVRALRIDDPLQRGLTELYGIAVCHPKANKVGKSSKA